MTRSSSFDDWRPYPIGEIARLFAGAPFRWWVSGGHALELHFGRSWRDHADTDIGVLRTDMDVVRTWMIGWDLAVAAQGELSSWSGRSLVDGQNNVWARRAGNQAWEIDLTIGAGTQEEWIYRRDWSITRPWRAAILHSSDGLPYLAPDLLLLFKSKAPRAKDHDDAGRAIPLLGVAHRSFLAANLPVDHPWQRLLAP